MKRSGGGGASTFDLRQIILGAGEGAIGSLRTTDALGKLLSPANPAFLSILSTSPAVCLQVVCGCNMVIHVATPGEGEEVSQASWNHETSATCYAFWALKHGTHFPELRERCKISRRGYRILRYFILFITIYSIYPPSIRLE